MNEIHDDPKLVADQMGHTGCELEFLYVSFDHEAQAGR